MTTLDYITSKYNFSIGRQHYVAIPNMDRVDLASLFAELNFNEGAEIGVEKGLYAEVLCKANPKLRLHCIDPWLASVYEATVHGVETEQQGYDKRYEETTKRLESYNSDIIRKTSLSAVNNFSDNSLDFVYIDGNHDFVNVTNDIEAWSKKVKIGGIISGHDYAYFPLRKFNHVKYVVQSYTRAHGIIPYFIVGADATGEPGIKRDAVRSWFWIKS